MKLTGRRCSAADFSPQHFAGGWGYLNVAGKVASTMYLDRPAGAAHAFRRGLKEGGNRLDLLYWLGWAEPGN